MKPIVSRLTYLAAGSILGVTIALAPGALASKTNNPPLPLEHLLTFSDVFDQIKKAYVEPVDDKTLLENAIRGMLAGLDPHSNYLVPLEAQDLHSSTRGRFGGLGIEVSMEDGFVKVVSPIDDTPAARAGIKAGDVIIFLDEKPVKGMTLSDAVKIMRGEPGTNIMLTIVREGENKPIKMTLTRATIPLRSVKGRMVEPGYGYVRISQFQVPTPTALRETLAKLKTSNAAPLKGLVLDLRNNPGGALSAAIDVSDTFLTDGVIVSTKGRIPSAKSIHHATASDILDGAPIVVLVNAGSASASEIVAGALKDNKRAIIMGSQTFGKGSVQNVIDLKNKSALKLTTARYYTPAGTSIQAKGITPDIALRNVTVTAGPPARRRVSEANLAGHLSAGHISAGDKGETKKSTGKARLPTQSTANKDATDDLAQKDYALFEAMNLLRGLNVYSAKAP
jgi:carboxyl-terminal processing protease